ncbi:hypothetical protein SPSYN_00885 [Sporotomaculum syntrophicum]|uniref:Uncharacterized protein n=1 Tax=Sporotomaculum syntrophicum TaxID=182264 RepID=A0A9D2WSJ6_9FIRM|nr:hypothetical protein SPSYN_00885 [Sporotomaculum syntrophicum]
MANQAAATSRAKVIRRQMRTPFPRMFSLLMGIRLAAKIKAIKAKKNESLFSKAIPPMVSLIKVDYKAFCSEMPAPLLKGKLYGAFFMQA